MPRPVVMLRASHQRGANFQKRSFEVEPPTMRRLRVSTALPRVEVPEEEEIREVAKELSLQASFTKRNKRLAEQGRECRIVKFQKVYRTVVARIRGYHGRDLIEMDLFLVLKEYVERERRSFSNVTRYKLVRFGRQHVDGREELIVRMAESGTLVQRPMAPKDARENGAEAYTQAAAHRRSDSRMKDRITVMSALPDNPGALFFITLGPATKNANGRDRVKCERRILSVQTPAEWNAWRRTRIKEPKVFRNCRKTGAREYLH